MEKGTMVKQMLAFQKTLFNNAFNAMITVQDQTEKMASAFLSQIPWVPEEGKKTLTNTVDSYKKLREDFKKAVDEGFLKIEGMVDPK